MEDFVPAAYEVRDHFLGKEVLPHHVPAQCPKPRFYLSSWDIYKLSIDEYEYKAVWISPAEGIESAWDVAMWITKSQGYCGIGVCYRVDKKWSWWSYDGTFIQDAFKTRKDAIRGLTSYLLDNYTY